MSKFTLSLFLFPFLTACDTAPGADADAERGAAPPVLHVAAPDDEPTTGGDPLDRAADAYPDCANVCFGDSRCYNLFTLQPPPGVHYAACAEPCDALDPDGASTCPLAAELGALCLPYFNPDPEAKLGGVCVLSCDDGPCPDGMACVPHATGNRCLWPQ